jgi:hypothetical protein
VESILVLIIVAKNTSLMVVGVDVKVNQNKINANTMEGVQSVFVEITLHLILKKENHSTSKKKVVVGAGVNQNAKNVISGHNYYIRILYTNIIMNNKVTTVSLSGKSQYRLNNLSGKSFSQKELPYEVNRSKIYIMNHIIFPLVSRQWKKLQENLYCLDNIKKKIDTFYHYYKNDDLFIYREIISALEVILSEHMQLEELEKSVYGTSKDLSTMIYKTALVKLKPEYEIYDILFGRPLRSKNEEYKQYIIDEIQQLLTNPDITFDKIRIYLTNKYNIS